MNITLLLFHNQKPCPLFVRPSGLPVLPDGRTNSSKLKVKSSHQTTDYYYGLPTKDFLTTYLKPFYLKIGYWRGIF